MSLVLLLLVLSGNVLFAQEEKGFEFGKGIKFRPNESSSISFHYGTQMWARYMQMNDGTTDVDGESIADTWDIGLRRTRFSMYGTFWNKLIAYMQLGMNSQAFNSSTKPQIYFHDVWSGFNFGNGKLFLGMGLHGWHGISRLSSVSYVKNMMIDHPGFNLANLGRTDQAGRQLGVFVKGNLGRFNYRASADKPFVRDERESATIDKSAYYPSSKTSLRAYVFYSFLDKEIFKSSYVCMNYLGTKKIFNVGAGFDYHPELMASKNVAGGFVKHNKKLFGLDVYLDYPLANGSAFALYSVANFFDYGPNYIRTYGVMNPHKKGDLPQGGGISHYNVGTGNIYYTTVGYLLPESAQLLSGKLQAIAAFHYKDFEALDEVAMQLDAGVNYFISSHHAKLSIQYSNWPTFGGATTPENKVSGFKHGVTMQLHVYL